MCHILYSIIFSLSLAKLIRITRPLGEKRTEQKTSYGLPSQNDSRTFVGHLAHPFPWAEVKDLS